VYTVGVCDDHPTIRRALARGLAQGGHDVVAAHDGREALALFDAGRTLDVIVMDIGLPDADGRDVVQALQAAGQHAPVLFLTALGDMQDKLSGFAAGGDDYVVKPFDLREVVVRVEALARRASSAAPSPEDLTVDPVTHAARTATDEVHLTPTEYRILASVLARRGEVVRRRAVVAAGWPGGEHVSENTIDSSVRRVRTKLAGIDSPVSLETVRGVGFRVRRGRSVCAAAWCAGPRSSVSRLPSCRRSSSTPSSTPRPTRRSSSGSSSTPCGRRSPPEG